ncbi:NAD(P)/FAD-dependent oxidoreductase [Nakamurella multipartita]|uniref:FAD-dependent pyridine nucleotide-disulfide oxidoreductase n=1 Tax=Nakamurella multipartita (strain ATCC 700099 / DSM 44233 / CIP 104796 / JCM 9543 / NBRC 105858 / Y-104) TaxID=479431 RepID=C8X641_NAKMY|nr:FAD-dependent oxidoreductase [Nakamurella multipartita]ACV76812.1 FAD-dependent pyridine nucleotide-disulfide oxidoreductase [Nakamurella multipartita DSM 44233]
MDRERQRPVSGRSGVVVIGSGFGGFFAARRLRRLRVDVTVLAATDSFLYTPLLPDVAVGTVDPRSVLIPLASTLRGVTIVRGQADRVDLNSQTVHYTDARGQQAELGYRRLLLAPGSVTKLLPIPGLSDHAIGLKTATEALYLREKVLAQLEAATTITDAARRREALTFVVVGAGHAGVELTAQMARLAHNLVPLYPGVTRDDVRWLLVDVADEVMPELGGSLGRSALRLLRRRGVDVRLGVSVERVRDHEVALTDGTRVRCGTLVWCAGVVGNPLIEALGLPTSKGRLVVDKVLRVPQHHDVYAIGDAAAVPDLTKPQDEHGQRPLCPPTAQHAMRQATAVARNIVADLDGRPLRPYRHHDLGLVVDLGGPDAAATPVGFRLRGRLAKAVTLGYHLYALPTGKRRIRVAVDWAIAGKRPDDVSLRSLPQSAALIVNAEDGGPAIS